MEHNRTSPQDAQNVRPARPQRMKIRGVTFLPAHPRLPRQALFPWGYVEDLRFATRRIRSVTFANAAELVRRQCLARTPLADFFSILLEAIQRRDEPARQQKKYGGDRQIDEIHVNAPCRDIEFSVARFARNTYPSGRQPSHISSRPFPFTPCSR